MLSSGRACPTQICEKILCSSPYARKIIHFRDSTLLLPPDKDLWEDSMLALMILDQASRNGVESLILNLDSFTAKTQRTQRKTISPDLRLCLMSSWCLRALVVNK